MNAIERLAANVLAPVMRNVLADYGCTATVQRPVVSTQADKQVVRNWADDAELVDIVATTLDPQSAAKHKIYGIIPECTLVILLPRLSTGWVNIQVADRIRITSGPFEGRTFEAMANGLPSHAATAVSVFEP